MPTTLSGLFRKRADREKLVRVGLDFLENLHMGNTGELDVMIADRRTKASSTSKLAENMRTIKKLAHIVCGNSSVKTAIKQASVPSFDRRNDPPTEETLRAIRHIDVYSNSNTAAKTEQNMQELLQAHIEEYRSTIMNLAGGVIPDSTTGNKQLDGLDQVYTAILNIIECVLNSLQKTKKQDRSRV